MTDVAKLHWTEIIRRNLNWSRKATSWDDVRVIERAELARIYPLIVELPVFTSQSEDDRIGPCSMLSEHVPDWDGQSLFILRVYPGYTFLVDTSGYKYCRYAVAISLPGEEVV